MTTPDEICTIFSQKALTLDLTKETLTEQQLISELNLTNLALVVYNKLEPNEQNMILNVTKEFPDKPSVFLFGYLMPIMLVVTIVTNTLVMIVLSKQHMRSPTNIVLFTMATVDLMTIGSPSPWYFYLFTLGNHDKYLYPTIACYAHQLMTDVIPIYFHTSSIWLALLLASQRYIYVCHPALANTWCTVPRVRKAILLILLIALLVQSSRVFDFDYTGVALIQNFKCVTACQVQYANWVVQLDIRRYHLVYYTFRIIFVLIGPCSALIALNFLLFKALKRAEHKRTELLHPNKLINYNQHKHYSNKSSKINHTSNNNNSPPTNCDSEQCNSHVTSGKYSNVRRSLRNSRISCDFVNCKELSILHLQPTTTKATTELEAGTKLKRLTQTLLGSGANASENDSRILKLKQDFSQIASTIQQATITELQIQSKTANLNQKQPFQRSLSSAETDTGSQKFIDERIHKSANIDNTTKQIKLVSVNEINISESKQAEFNLKESISSSTCKCLQSDDSNNSSNNCDCFDSIKLTISNEKLDACLSSDSEFVKSGETTFNPICDDDQANLKSNSSEQADEHLSIALKKESISYIDESDDLSIEKLNKTIQDDPKQSKDVRVNSKTLPFNESTSISSSTSNINVLAATTTTNTNNDETKEINECSVIGIDETQIIKAKTSTGNETNKSKVNNNPTNKSKNNNNKEGKKLDINLDSSSSSQEIAYDQPSSSSAIYNTSVQCQKRIASRLTSKRHSSGIWKNFYDSSKNLCNHGRLSQAGFFNQLTSSANNDNCSNNKCQVMHQHHLHSSRSIDSNRTTSMLIVVVTVFLIIELPVALTTIVHVIINMFDIFESVDYTWLHYIKIFSNFLIILSYPVNFTIYCSMSKRFRETFASLFLRGSFKTTLSSTSPPTVAAAANDRQTTVACGTDCAAINANNNMSAVSGGGGGKNWPHPSRRRSTRNQLQQTEFEL